MTIHPTVATVSYVLEGEIDHRDSLGSYQPIRPGAINWMNAGPLQWDLPLATPRSSRPVGGHRDGLGVAGDPCRAAFEPSFVRGPPILRAGRTPRRDIAGFEPAAELGRALLGLLAQASKHDRFQLGSHRDPAR